MIHKMTILFTKPQSFSGYRSTVFFIIQMVFFVAVFTSINAFSADAELEDKELLSRKVLEYFKGVSSETGKPISLKITVSEASSEENIFEDEKELAVDAFPEGVSKRFLVTTSEALKKLLPSFMEDHDPNRLMLSVKIWVDAPAHREKVNGFCVIRPSGK